jgi:hypothetical protein
MTLTKVDRERITDSQLNIQAAAHTLGEVDMHKVDGLQGIQECLEDAERKLRKALRD